MCLPADITDHPDQHSQNSPEFAEATEMGNDTIAKDQSLLQTAKLDIGCTKATREVSQDPSSPKHGTSLENIIPDPVPSTRSDSSDRSNLCKLPPSTKTEQRATGEMKTPEELRPFKKARPRMTQRRSRRKSHTATNRHT